MKLKKTLERCNSTPDQPKCPIENVIRNKLEPRLLPYLQRSYLGHPKSLDTARLKLIVRSFCLDIEYIQVTHALSNNPNSIILEAEIFLGSIAGKTSRDGKRKELMTRMNSISGELVRSVWNQLVLKEDSREADLISLRNAWEAWELVQSSAKTGMASFGWTALRCVLEMLRRLEEVDRVVVA